MPDDDPAREGLPGRCDKGWFSKVFLAGKGMDRTGSDSIWDLTGTFQAYDPMAQMCAIEALKKKYFDHKRRQEAERGADRENAGGKRQTAQATARGGARFTGGGFGLN